MREHVSSHTRRGTGARRITPDLLQIDKLAEGFKKLSDEVKSPAQLLGAFKAAAPFLGLNYRLVHTVDWLFRYTRPQDWQIGSRPIVWPSAREQQDDLILKPTQVKYLNRELIRRGLITMKDSGNGKRYGRRDAKGLIIEAYGFDLSPIALRYDEFVKIAAEGRARRQALGKLRRRRSTLQTRITQMIAAGEEHGLDDRAWQDLTSQAKQLAQALRKVERIDEMTLGLESLERRVTAAKARLESVLLKDQDGAESDPRWSENRPQQYNYNAPLYPEQDTIIASKNEIATSGSDLAPPIGTAAPQHNHAATASRPKPPLLMDVTAEGRDALGTMHLRAHHILDMAPRLAQYVTRPHPEMHHLLDAADFLAGELRISRSLFARACHVVGRDTAVIMVAICSTKPAKFFDKNGAGAYFNAMIERAREGNLHLDRSIWGIRKKLWESSKP